MRTIASLAAVALAAGAVLIFNNPAVATPAPCGGVTQISDASLDGHHANTDVVGAWFSEQAGLQAVMRLRIASFSPAHEDSEAAGFALLYVVGGVRRYVRAEAPRAGAMRFDYGTWTPTGGFSSAGLTTGVVEPTTSGTVTIDLPALPAGAKIAQPFVLTYDGEDSPGQLHWVDRAPGGTSPTTDEFGADYVVGSCGLGGSGSAATVPGGSGAANGTSPADAGAGSAAVTAVDLKAPTRITGGGLVRVTGSIRPVRAGVAVALRVRGARTTTRAVTTGSDGVFSAQLSVQETSQLRASADGVSSQTSTVTVFSKVRVKVRRLRSGGVIVTGQVWPTLPGRILWLRDGAVSPTATASPTAGRFRLRLSRPRDGRYQAVFIPSGHRAERSTSNTGVIR